MTVTFATPQSTFCFSFYCLPSKARKNGFTLIELLVVILILGILAAVGVPNLLNQIGKARESEGKQILSSVGRAQQAYFVEKGHFSSSLDDLDSIVSSKHFIIPEPNVVSSNAVTQQANAIDSINKNVRNYDQGVYYNPTSRTFSSILCQSVKPNTSATAPDSNTGICVDGDLIR